MKPKKLLVILLACVMLLSCNVVSAFAAAPTDAPTSTNSLQYVNFSSVWADIYKTSWGYYDVSGGATTYSNDITIELTVYIETYYSYGWDRYDDWEITDSDTGLVAAAGSRTLTEMGVYRAHTIAEAYKDGVLIETVEAYSTNVAL